MLRPDQQIHSSRKAVCRLVQGNLGRGTIKVSAVDRPRWTIEVAVPRVFRSERRARPPSRQGSSNAMLSSSCASRAPPPTACPNSTSSRPSLGVLQDRGFRVALVTDGRMSGASGKVPAGDPRLSRGEDGRGAGANCAMVIWCASARKVADWLGLVDQAEWACAASCRTPRPKPLAWGRELFALMRHYCRSCRARRIGRRLAAAGL